MALSIGASVGYGAGALAIPALPSALAPLAARAAAEAVLLAGEGVTARECLEALVAGFSGHGDLASFASALHERASFVLATVGARAVVVEVYPPGAHGSLEVPVIDEAACVLTGYLALTRLGARDVRVAVPAVIDLGAERTPCQCSNRDAEPLVLLRVGARPLLPPVRAPGASRRVAIVGGGFSGAAALVHLLATLPADVQIAWIERGPKLGLGIAYAAVRPELLLNVPAGRMSLDPAHPLEFAAFAGVDANPAVFCARATYGRYVVSRVAEAIAAHPARVTLHRAEAVAARAGEVVLDDGSRLDVDHTVLATGIAPRTAQLPQFGSEATVDGWNDEAVAAIDPGARVLVLGTGLTALDVVATLAHGGFRGTLTMLSRRGLVPAAHLRAAAPVPERVAAAAKALASTEGLRLAALVRAVRRLVRDAREEGVPWQLAIDALRPYVSTLWRALSARDRLRFVRRVRPYWDVVRHRAPVEAIERVESLRREGRLEIVAASVCGVRGVGADRCVEVRERGGELRTLHVDVVVRCIGPAVEGSDLASPLLQDMIAAGSASRDAAGLGLRVDAEGRVCDAQGRPSEAFSALGALRRAEAWETTAVPEIARDARALAERIAQQFVASPLREAGAR